MAKQQINLDQLSDDELQSLRSQILSKVAERLRLNPGADLMYDRHGSGHSNSTSAIKEINIKGIKGAIKSPLRGR